MNKKEVRKSYRDKRQALTQEKYESLNNDLFGVIQEHLPLYGVEVAHIFLPISSRNEVDTWPLIKWIWKEHPHVKVVTPVMDYSTHGMTHAQITPDSAYSPDKFGIPTPQEIVPVEAEDIDLVILPLLAVDQHGSRVGYGMGHYDRFLSTCREDVLKVGVSFFEPVEGVVETNEFDIPLDFCATPEDFFSFMG